MVTSTNISLTGNVTDCTNTPNMRPARFWELQGHYITIVTTFECQLIRYECGNMRLCVHRLTSLLHWSFWCVEIHLNTTALLVYRIQNFGHISSHNVPPTNQGDGQRWFQIVCFFRHWERNPTDVKVGKHWRGLRFGFTMLYVANKGEALEEWYVTYSSRSLHNIFKSSLCCGLHCQIWDIIYNEPVEGHVKGLSVKQAQRIDNLKLDNGCL